MTAWSLLYDVMEEQQMDPIDQVADELYDLYVNHKKLKQVASENFPWKYNEDKILDEVRDYLQSTYHSHYTSDQSQTQTLDLIESIGDAEPFSRSNAIKYLSRFGKKDGKNKKDLLKAIHYCFLLYHFSGLVTNETN
jgi:hypothetical protein